MDENDGKKSNGNKELWGCFGAIGAALITAIVSLVIALPTLAPFFTGTTVTPVVVAITTTPQSDTPSHTNIIEKPTLTTSNIATNTPPASEYNYTQDDINAIIGIDNWRCINGSPRSISIDSVPYNYIVAFPFSRIDTKGNFYSIGSEVLGGDMGTGWLISDLPNSSCASEKGKVDSQIINAFFGKNTWVCIENSQPSGINLYVVPDGFSIQRPIAFIDYGGKRYYQGDRLPMLSSGAFMRVWFESEIPRNECP